MTEPVTTGFSPDEQSRVDKFLAETTLFLGPDPDIMRDHKSAPRTAEEERLLDRAVMIDPRHVMALKTKAALQFWMVHRLPLD